MKKKCLNDFIEFVFLDHSKDGVDVKVNVLRKYFINRFHEIIHDKCSEKIQDDMYAVRENVLYMLSFRNFVEENPGGDDNDD